MPDQIETAARDYLHTNCSFCHQPGGPGGGLEDFRYTVSFADMNVCDVVPSLGDFGLPNARLLAPGAPESSVLLFRMLTLLNGRMPPLASTVVDDLGTQIISDWILSILGCP